MVKRLLLGLVVVAVVLVALAAGVGLMETFPAVDTTTNRIQNAGWEGAGATGGTMPGELLDDDEYVASWSPDLVGQRVTIQGAVHDVGTFECLVESIRYDVSLHFGAKSWPVLAWERGNNPLGAQVGQWFPFPSVQWDVDHPETGRLVPHGSYVHATASIKCALGSWVTVAEDNAVIVSGIGSVRWSKSTYQVGEKASVSWDIPYVSDDASGTGWSLYVYGSAQNKEVVPLTRLRTLTGSMSYTVSPLDFTQAADCRNELTVVLRNELWDKDFETATTVDATSLIPKVTITEVGPRDAMQGDTVTVKWTVEVNPQSKSPIQKVIVKYGYGGVDNEKELPAGDSSFSFVATAEGTVHFEVIAYDGGCRAAIDMVDIRIGEPEPEETTDLLLLVLGVVLLVIGLLMAVFSGKLPVPGLGRFGVVVVGFVLAGVGLVLIVTFLGGLLA